MISPTAPASPATSSDPLLERLRLSTAGTYDIAGELGRGGMAVVYLAHDLKLDRRVAIKVMDPRLSLTPGMSDRFLLEARIAARLQHPNIIVVHDIRQDHELSYFVMSFVEGMAADHLCQQATPVAIDDVRWIVAGAARALAHAHAEGIVHRDIKPANILVNVKGDVILTDFGIAKALGGTSLTQTGTQVGTPSYMSPEQFTEKPVGPPSDQYSLGVTAYVLLTGRLPFSGELYQLILAHSNQVPTPVRELRPDCPTFLADAVMRMLEKEPAQRWPSLHDLADAVSESLPANGGRALAAAARLVQQQRAQEVPALMALTPVSPVPAGRSPSTPPPSTPVPAPPPAPVIAALRLDANSFDAEVGASFTLPLHAFDANGAPVSTTGLDVLLDRPDAIAVDVASWLVEPRLPGDTRLIVAPRHAFASGGTPAIRASCVIRVRAASTVVAPEAATPVAPQAAPQAATPVAPPSPRRTKPVMLIAGGLAAAALAFIVYRQSAGTPDAAGTSATTETTVAQPTTSLPTTPATDTPDSTVVMSSIDASRAGTTAADTPSAPPSARAMASGTPSNRPAPSVSAPNTQKGGASPGADRSTTSASRTAVPTESQNSPGTRIEPDAVTARASAYAEPEVARSAPTAPPPTPSEPTTANTTPPVGEAPRLPSAAEMRQAASDLFNALRATKGASVREIANFFRDGDDHRMAMVGTVKIMEGRTTSRAQFELQVSKRDFSGRQAVGIALVTFFAERRDGQVVPALESVGPISRVR